MSTAWYIVDEEGKVGILKFIENGPVPKKIEWSSCEENIGKKIIILKNFVTVP